VEELLEAGSAGTGVGERCWGGRRRGDAGAGGGAGMARGAGAGGDTGLAGDTGADGGAGPAGGVGVGGGTRERKKRRGSRRRQGLGGRDQCMARVSRGFLFSLLLVGRRKYTWACFRAGPGR
jgi:hypothetical protein